MTTSAAQPTDQIRSHSEQYYDPDEEALPKGSPPMNPVKLNLACAPSPSFTLPRHPDPMRGHAAMIKIMEGGRDSDASREIISPTRQDDSHSEVYAEGDHSTPPSPAQSLVLPIAENAVRPIPRKAGSGPFLLDLKGLAAGALAFTSHSSSPQIPATAPHSLSRNGSNGQGSLVAGKHSIPTVQARGGERRSSRPEEHPAGLTTRVDHPGRRQSMALARPLEVPSPTSPQRPGSGGLPPLQIDSPRSDSSIHGQALPSIRQHFSDLQLSPETELPGLRHSASFSRSPPSSLPGISSMSQYAGPHATSPTSPNSGLRPDLPSPQALPSTGYPFHSFGAGHARRIGVDHSSSTTDTPASDQSSTAVGNTTTERLDGLAISTQPGGYACNFSGCTAAPFQTQYLLNSHANVHSSARPHYCPVPGCSRSEGGKGFKRKNEMIRHGLVHESPGYVCPFCPDREHKYPRPDNLQRYASPPSLINHGTPSCATQRPRPAINQETRHVRVHHMDKDKDDPLLRDVLSQRPDGPSRGRRRRGAAS